MEPLLAWKERDNTWTASVDHAALWPAKGTQTTTFTVTRVVHTNGPYWRLSWGYAVYAFRGKKAAQDYAESTARVLSRRKQLT